MWRNDTKCKYIFMIPLKNLARIGLKTTTTIWQTYNWYNVCAIRHLFNSNDFDKHGCVMHDIYHCLIALYLCNFTCILLMLIFNLLFFVIRYGGVHLFAHIIAFKGSALTPCKAMPWLFVADICRTQQAPYVSFTYSLVFKNLSTCQYYC